MRNALLAVLLVAPLGASSQVAPPDGAPPPVWELAAVEPGEPAWAGVSRLREAEATYREVGRPHWQRYAQYRAQAEATVGEHAAALAWWDPVMSPRRDSVGVLPPGTRAVDALDYLVKVADTSRVLMVNERHHAVSDRSLTLELLEPLYERGFRYLAAEAFSDHDSLLNVRPYPVSASGVYVGEPVFGEVVREALRLGYTLVPYEITAAQREAAPTELSPQQRREWSQAQNLRARIFADDPDALVLVHAGYEHIKEEASDRRSPMAHYFREATGIDPVTVDQTVLSERSAPAFEHPVYRAAVEGGHVDGAPVVLVGDEGRPAGLVDWAVDVHVVTPRTRYEDGRPGWMVLGGRRAAVDVPVPECAGRRCYLEARPVGEPREAVPLDRTAVEGAGSARVFLPVGEAVDIEVFSTSGDLVRTVRYDPEP